MAENDDTYVLLVADLHKTAAEALARRQKAEELLARARRTWADLRALQETAFTTTMARTIGRKPPIYVRRWPGVDRRL
jgi:hypothetical protein